MFGTDMVPTPIRKTETVELSFVSILVMDLHAEGVQKPRRAPTFDMQCQR